MSQARFERQGKDAAERRREAEAERNAHECQGALLLELSHCLGVELSLMPTMPVCGYCTGMTTDTPPEECHIWNNGGDVPKEGYCTYFNLDRARDPRGKALAAFLRRSSSLGG